MSPDGQAGGGPAARPRVTLVTGGARCGKSRFALEQVAGRPAPAFVATAEALDGEMAERIRRHREERGTAFTTFEAPLDPAAALDRLPGGCGAAVVDCVTVWLGNLVHHWREERRREAEGEAPRDRAAGGGAAGDGAAEGGAAEGRAAGDGKPGDGAAGGGGGEEAHAEDPDRPPTDVAAWPEIGRLLQRLDSPPCDLVLVTNEVGWGLVPPTPLGRAFRDLAGRVNQELAARADRVVLVVSGLPLEVKTP